MDEFSSLMPNEGGSRFPIVPMLLIALGSVFLLDTLEIYEVRRLVRFWPVLMIGMGLYLLFARMKKHLGKVEPDEGLVLGDQHPPALLARLRVRHELLPLTPRTRHPSKRHTHGRCRAHQRSGYA